MVRRRATILLKTQGHIEEGEIVSDYGYLGDPLVYPGMGVQRTVDGIDVGIGAATGARGVVAVAIEDHLLGKTIEDPYVEGGTCRFVVPMVGDEVQVLVAEGQNLAVGAMVVCNTSGLWIAATAEANQPFQVMEATGGALASDSLVRVKRV